MAGYSGTPLPRKLGIQKNFRVALHAMPADVSADLKEKAAGVCGNTLDQLAKEKFRRSL